MTTLNIIAYTISVLFLVLLVKATVKVNMQYWNDRKIRKNSEAVKAEMNGLKKMGFKEFRFGPKKETLIMAPDYKAASAEYQRLLKHS